MEFVRALRETEGPIFLPQLPGYLRSAGKPPVAQTTALADLDRLRPDLLVDVERSFARGDYAAAAPEPPPYVDPFAEAIRRHFGPARVVAVGGPALRYSLGTVGGLYVRSSAAQPQPSGLVRLERHENHDLADEILDSGGPR